MYRKKRSLHGPQLKHKKIPDCADFSAQKETAIKRKTAVSFS